MLLVGRYAEKQRPRPRQAWDSRRRQYPLRSTDDAHAPPFPGPISSRDRGSDSRAAVSRPASIFSRTKERMPRHVIPWRSPIRRTAFDDHLDRGGWMRSASRSCAIRSRSGRSPSAARA